MAVDERDVHRVLRVRLVQVLVLGWRIVHVRGNGVHGDSALDEMSLAVPHELVRDRERESATSRAPDGEEGVRVAVQPGGVFVGLSSHYYCYSS